LQIEADTFYKSGKQCCQFGAVKDVLLLWEQTVLLRFLLSYRGYGREGDMQQRGPGGCCREWPRRRKTPVDGIEVLLSGRQSRRQRKAIRAPVSLAPPPANRLMMVADFHVPGDTSTQRRVI